MNSLQKLLADESFQHSNFSKTKKHLNVAEDDEHPIPRFICHDLKSLTQSTDNPFNRKGSSVFSSERFNSGESAIDESSVKALISILSGYVGRYGKDSTFRESIRNKCRDCLVIKRKDLDDWDDGTFANFELGFESIEKFIGDSDSKKELSEKLLADSIQLLTVIANSNSKKSKNPHVSACVHLYLSVAYKLQKKDRISATHLLQVFEDSPFLARTHLVPDLWEHLFLPHLLHLKIWHHNEIENLSNFQHYNKEKSLKALNKAYNGSLDNGTIQFALYYKEWLKIGGKPPPIPLVPFPSKPAPSRRISLDSYTSSRSSIDRNLYLAVFGPTPENHSVNFDKPKRDLWMQEDGCKSVSYVSDNVRRSHRRSSSYTSSKRGSKSVDYFGPTPENNPVIFGGPKMDLWIQEDGYKSVSYVSDKARMSHRRSSSYTSSKRGSKSVGYFGLFSCQSIVSECLVKGKVIRSNSIRRIQNSDLPLSDLVKAIHTISSSNILINCEMSIRLIAKAWIESYGNPLTENALSKAPVLEGIVEVLFASTDDEILELGISILADFVSRNEANRLIVLNADPQLEIFIRLLKSSSLFLKAAVLLYELKPKATQMISIEWVALALRVLEFGDHFQTLFAVKCMPRKAAMYFLDQILTGFDKDRNLENSSQVVSLGGLSLLLRISEKGDIEEKNNAVKLMLCCVRADKNCVNYLVENVNKASLLELIALGIRKKSNLFGFAFLTELLCLNRRSKITNFLIELNRGSNGLNTMQIFLVYLQRASPEERPLVAAILLQLDLLGDPLKFSLYREDAVEAIIESLDSGISDSRIQEESARALSILGGHFRDSEGWFLQESVNLYSSNEEEKAILDLRKKAVIVLLNTGSKRFLEAISNAIVNGIPSLIQACLFTVSWMNRVLVSKDDKNIRSLGRSPLLKRPQELVNFDRTLINNAGIYDIVS